MPNGPLWAVEEGSIGKLSEICRVLSTRLQRRFTLLDTMILIAAVASCVAFTKHHVHYFSNEWNVRFDEQEDPLQTPFFKYMLIRENIQAWIAILSIALLVIRVRQPRPSRRRLLCQPGTVARLAVSILTLSRFACGMIPWTMFFFSKHFDQFYFFDNMIRHIGLGIDLILVPAWLLLALSGRWRADSGWIDRSGRILGCVGITEFFMFEIFNNLVLLWPMFSG